MKTYRLGIEAALEILGGKWKALIICLLMSGPQRTGALRRLIPGVSEKVLIQQLREGRVFHYRLWTVCGSDR